MSAVIQKGAITIDDNDFIAIVEVHHITADDDGYVLLNIYNSERLNQGNVPYAYIMLEGEQKDGTWVDGLNNIKFYDFVEEDEHDTLIYDERKCSNEDILISLSSLYSGTKAEGRIYASGESKIKYKHINKEDLPGSDDTHIDLTSLTRLGSYFTWLSNIED